MLRVPGHPELQWETLSPNKQITNRYHRATFKTYVLKDQLVTAQSRRHPKTRSSKGWGKGALLETTDTRDIFSHMLPGGRSLEHVLERQLFTLLLVWI